MKDYVLEIAEISGESFEQTIDNMIKERQEEMRKLVSETVALKQLKRREHSETTISTDLKAI